MKKYEVAAIQTNISRFKIEAEDEEEAKDKVADGEGEELVDFYDSETVFEAAEVQ